MHLRNSVTIAAFVAFASISTIANANLLTNGSFEDTTHLAVNFGSGSMLLDPGATSLAGWSVIGGGNLLWCNPGDCGVAPSNGNYSLDLTGLTNSYPYAGVSQTINTVLNGSYLLSFDIGSRDGDQISIQATAGGASQTYTTNATPWKTETLSFTGTGGPTTISLLGTAAAGYDLSLDNVIVSGPPGVPEPSTWAMMLVGVGGLGGALRLGRRTATRLG